MADLTRQKIRASVDISGVGTVSTPYVMQFNVTKQRGQKTTFSISVKIHMSKLSTIETNEISISAGEEGKIKKIFTGYILASKASPCFEDPEYIVLNLSGSDVLYKLEGAKYTRRQIAHNQKWSTIDGVVREAPESGQFNLKHKPTPVVSVDHKVPEQKENRSTLKTGVATLSVTRKDVLGNPIDFKFSEYKDIPNNQ